eukprot:SAG22_NODE_254_length_13588_cov_10.695678_6_plen_210_part_00
MPPCPEATAPLLSRLFFLWNDSLIDTGYRRPLQQSDIWDCPFQLSTRAAAAGYAAACRPEDDTSPGKHYLLRRMYRANRREFWLSACFRGGQEVAQLCQPLLLAEILRFLDAPAGQLWWGLLAATLLFAAAVSKTLLENHYFITCVRCGIRTRAAAVDLVYRKSLRLSSAARHSSSSGKIVSSKALSFCCASTAFYFRQRLSTRFRCHR